jgi:hypothetical protein
MRERGEDTLDMVRVSSVGGGPAHHRLNIPNSALQNSIYATSNLINDLEQSAITQRSS